MAEETQKRVTVVYTVEDHAVGALGEIRKKSDEAGKSVEGLEERFAEVKGASLAMAAGILGVGLGFEALVEKVRESNTEFGAAQKSIASTQATILAWPKTMSAIDKFTGSMKLAKGVTEELEEAAASFGMALPDVAAAYKTVGISAAPLHLSQKQWIDLTVKSAAAAKQFGISGEEAANTIGRALVTKSIKASSDLGKYLVENVGGNLHKLNNAQILAKMDKALGQSAEIAKKMGEGLDGSIGRIQAKVDSVFRDVTGPLFKEVGLALDGFDKKLGSGADSGKTMRDVFAGKLVGAFHDLEDVTSFLADHWKTIAVVVAGMKLPGLISDMGSLAAGISKTVGSLGSGVSGAEGLMGMANAIGPVIGALGAMKIGLDAVVDIIDQKLDESRAQQLRAMGSAGSMETLASLSKQGAGPLAALQDKAAKSSMAQLSKAGIVTEKGDVDLGKFRTDWQLMEFEQKKRLMDTFGVKAGPGVDVGRSVAEAIAGITDRFLAQVAPKVANADDFAKNLKTNGKPQVNFTGENHFDFKFEDTDPDRVFLRFQEGMENNVLRRTSSPLSDPLAD